MYRDTAFAVEGNCIQADAELKSSKGCVYSVVLTAGSDTATLILYDNTAAAGERELVLKAAANTSVSYTPRHPLLFNTGIYADISGTSPYATVQFA